MALTMDNRIQKDSVLYPNRLKLYHEIYIGHTPTINYKVDVPMNGCNVWNIDTGAAFTGKLSIMNIDTKQFFQSDIVKELYPNEVGRNKK
jgi:serine/threonine protein phosphatase 1